MKKQPEVTALTRENLIEAFWSLYCQKKIEHISIKEITDTAGYHRSTFYEYFIDIYDLLNQVEDSLLAYIKQEVSKSLVIVQKDDVLQGLADVYESKGKYLGVLLGENGDPYFSKKLKSILRPVLIENFGIYESDIHTGYIIEFGFSAILASITHWYQRNKNIPSNDLVFMVRSMLMNGVYPMIKKYSSLSSE